MWKKQNLWTKTDQVIVKFIYNLQNKRPAVVQTEFWDCTGPSVEKFEPKSFFKSLDSLLNLASSYWSYFYKKG